MRRRFLASLFALMSLHLGAVLLMSHLRHEGPSHNLRLTSTSGALVLFGQNSIDITVYRLFGNWHELENYLEENSLALPPMVEVSKVPPAFVQIEAIDPNSSQSGEHKILWSQTGLDRYVIHTPDSRSAEVLRNYVYYHGFEKSHLGFSLPISAYTY